MRDGGSFIHGCRNVWQRCSTWWQREGREKVSGTRDGCILPSPWEQLPWARPYLLKVRQPLRQHQKAGDLASWPWTCGECSRWSHVVTILLHAIVCHCPVQWHHVPGSKSVTIGVNQPASLISTQFIVYWLPRLKKVKYTSNASQTEVHGIRSHYTPKQSKAFRKCFPDNQNPLLDSTRTLSHHWKGAKFRHMIELFPFLLASLMKMKDQQTWLQNCTHSSAATTDCLWAEK